MAGALVLALVLGGVTWWAVSRASDESPGSSAPTNPPTSDQPGDQTDDPSGDPSGGATTADADPGTATPRPGRRTVRTCWDGVRAVRDLRCDTDSNSALFWAFGFTFDQCDAAFGKGGGHAADSFECYLDGDRSSPAVHLARYLDRRLRSVRMSHYEPCRNTRPAGTVACGPARDGRHLRTYRTTTGLLMYASSLDKSTLDRVEQRSAHDLLRGVRR